MSLFAYCYVSEAAPGLDNTAMEKLVDLAEAYNQRHGITGCLLYDSGHFVQVLEGSQSELEALMQRIAVDPRHLRFRVVWSGPIPKRMYELWSMRLFNLESAALLSGKDPSVIAELRQELTEFVAKSTDKLGELPSFFRFCMACIREEREPEEVNMDRPMFMAS